MSTTEFTVIFSWRKLAIACGLAGPASVHAAAPMGYFLQAPGPAATPTMRFG
jgi:hypothetical protein